MSQAALSTQTITNNAYGAAAGATETLSTLVYHSKAVQPLSATDLYRLARAAQVRNHAESITGLMLYDDSHFFQWLEGPSESLARIMRSIRDDPRHTEIEILNSQQTTARFFGDWNMKLALNGPRDAAWKREVIKPSRDIIKDLRRQPDAAAHLLAKLAPPPALPDIATPVSVVPKTTHEAKAILHTLVLESVVSELAAKLTPTLLAPRLSAVDLRVRELAGRLIASDQPAALALIKDACARECLILPCFTTLLEPTARHLGDLFRDDLCSEFDVTLGLCQLQIAVRVLSAGVPPVYRDDYSAPLVLVVPEPGELHSFSGFLNSESLWNAGWAPRIEYPRNDQALEDLVSATWFDVLDLSLSAALSRTHWLPRMTRTIALVRRASRNPDLSIVVSGRVFAEQADAHSLVGADAGVTGALQVKQTIVRSLNDRQVLRDFRIAS
jgi:hypothetical protein